MIGDGILAIASSLILAASPIECVAGPTTINIKPVTNPIQYDFSQTAEQLTEKGVDSVSPYGPDVELVVKGKRYDKPHMKFQIDFGSAYHRKEKVWCVWYKEITVDIVLSPKIYIAKGYNKGKCGQFILEHEKKHVLVDRQVMNKYSKKMGKDLQDAVNATGALGPHKSQHIENVRQSMTSYIDKVLASAIEEMTVEMDRRQQAVDSKEEYDLGSKICRDITIEHHHQGRL